MPRPKSHSERVQIIVRINELVHEHDRITTKEIAAMFELHRTTAEKYIRTAIERGELIRYGRCGVFPDLRAIIDFDLKRYTARK